MPFNCFSNFRISHMEEVKLEPIESEPESNVSHWKELEESSSDNFVDVKPDYLNSDQPQPFLFIKQENLHFDVDQKGLERFKDEGPDQIIEANDSLAQDELRESWIEDNDLKEESSDVETRLVDNEVGYNPKSSKLLHCKLCNYTTKVPSDLRSHTRTHYQQFEHKCLKCKFSTPVEFCLKRHMDVAHPTQKDKKCKFCDFRTVKDRNLKNHFETVHLKVKKYKCRFCDHKTYWKSKSIMHMNSVHLKNKKFECPYCDYNAAQSTTLRTHIKGVHSGSEDLSSSLI